ncbi:MAG TPA: hypothetical protein DCE44_21315 [Verrucomicrobiales bacterium]|nr:hypothetical protein [Verrucomicrobiales bacterium]
MAASAESFVGAHSITDAAIVAHEISLVLVENHAGPIRLSPIRRPPPSAIDFIFIGRQSIVRRRRLRQCWLFLRSHSRDDSTRWWGVKPAFRTEANCSDTWVASSSRGHRLREAHDAR